MEHKKIEQLQNSMIEIYKNLQENLEDEQIKEIMYYEKIDFGTSGLYEEKLYIVEIEEKIQDKTVDSENIIEQDANEQNIDKIKINYLVYDKDGILIATVDENGKLHFTEQYLESLKQIDERYFRLLDLDDIDFELPEELEENDLIMTKQELEDKKQEIEKQNEKNNLEDKAYRRDEETEEEKREKTAQTLGLNKSEIRSMATINPTKKITDEHNLIDFMPEARGFEEICIVCSTPNEKSNGIFTVIGVKPNGERQVLNSIEPVEAVQGTKDVISINEDGTRVTEKQVQGLFRINSGNREDGLSVSIGDYGMIDVDLVRNIMDKETRRITPITTQEIQNKRETTYQVRENAGDSKEEVEKEGEIYRKKQKQGIDPQSLDGIETESVDGQLTIDELKQKIVEEMAKDENTQDMSRDEMNEEIQTRLEKEGLYLTKEETEKTTNEIRGKIVDEIVGNRQRI